ncbi:MAG: hypothetical protein ACRC1K_18965, partial [Planctomycetia bacterium]
GTRFGRAATATAVVRGKNVAVDFIAGQSRGFVNFRRSPAPAASAEGESRSFRQAAAVAAVLRPVARTTAATQDGGSSSSLVSDDRLNPAAIDAALLSSLSDD